MLTVPYQRHWGHRSFQSNYEFFKSQDADVDTTRKCACLRQPSKHDTYYSALMYHMCQAETKGPNSEVQQSEPGNEIFWDAVACKESCGGRDTVQ